MRFLVVYLLTCSAAFGQTFTVEVVRPAAAFTVVVVPPETVTVKTKTRTKYLVSEPWCRNCPAEKIRFKARGFPESQIITIADAKARFGIVVTSVPFEFEADADSPQSSPQTPTRSAAETTARSHAEIHAANHLRTVHGTDATGLSLAEMEALHDKIHGGAQYHFPAISQPVYRSQPQTLHYRQRTRRRR
tara:strand:+ start:210 stop:779 length:570 start_codon:yes stop_codon:yes gene_type:complete